MHVFDEVEMTTKEQYQITLLFCDKSFMYTKFYNK